MGLMLQLLWPYRCWSLTPKISYAILATARRFSRRDAKVPWRTVALISARVISPASTKNDAMDAAGKAGDEGYVRAVCILLYAPVTVFVHWFLVSSFFQQVIRNLEQNPIMPSHAWNRRI